MRKIAAITGVTFFVMCALTVMGRAQSGPGGVVVQVVTISTQDANTVLRRVEAVMVRESKVPLRWPTYLGPADIGAGHPLFVNLLSESATDYKMELGWSEDCIGGAYCHYGTVQGNNKVQGDSTPNISAEAGPPLKLQSGIAGYFSDSKCNAANTRCSDPMVSWTEGASHYVVSLKDGKKDELIRMANSAIASAHEQARP